MASFETQLWGLVQEIEPTQAQKDAASRSHQYLRDILCTGQFADRIVTSFLSGSYARDTAIRPIDDVDIVFVINPGYWTLPAHLPNTLPIPGRVLESFAAAIRYRYPVSSVFGQRRSVRLQLNHLDIDVVPAVNADTTGVVIWIPDETANQWIKSSPRQHAEFATTTNQRSGGRLKPLVKLLKFWNANLPSTSKLRSFAVETIATRLYSNVGLSSLQEGLIAFLDFICYLGGAAPHYQWRQDGYGMVFNWGQAYVTDVTGANLFRTEDLGVVARFVENAKISRDWLATATKATTVDTTLGYVRQAFRI